MIDSTDSTQLTNSDQSTELTLCEEQERTQAICDGYERYQEILERIHQELDECEDLDVLICRPCCLARYTPRRWPCPFISNGSTSSHDNDVHSSDDSQPVEVDSASPFHDDSNNMHDA